MAHLEIFKRYFGKNILSWHLKSSQKEYRIAICIPKMNSFKFGNFPPVLKDTLKEKRFKFNMYVWTHVTRD